MVEEQKKLHIELEASNIIIRYAEDSITVIVSTNVKILFEIWTLQ